MALRMSVIFAAEATWLILAHHVSIDGAAKWCGMVSVAWLGAALGAAALP